MVTRKIERGRITVLDLNEDSVGSTVVQQRLVHQIGIELNLNGYKN